MRVAILGGTGKFGRPLARRLHEIGFGVTIGSRDEQKARDAAEVIGVGGMANQQAVGRAELVVLAVAAPTALDTAKALRRFMRAPLLCVASEVDFAGGQAFPVIGAKSLAERISETVEVPVLAGLHSISATKLAGDDPLDEDAFVCGNDREAKTLALELAERLVTGHVIDAGPLAVARALEGMTAVILNVNRRYKAHAGLRVTGLD